MKYRTLFLRITAILGIITVFFIVNLLHSLAQDSDLYQEGEVTQTNRVYLPTVVKVFSSSGWNQLAGNPQRTGYVTNEVEAPWKLRWIWNGPIGGGDFGPASNHLRLPKGVQPVIGSEKLYIGHSDGMVRAVSEITGQLVWTSPNLGASIVNTGAYDSDTNSFYVGTTNGRFWQINAENGNVIRSVQLGGQIVMAPLLVGNLIFIGSTNHFLYQLNKADLTIINNPYDAGASLVGSLAYSSNHNGLVIALAEDRSVHAVQVGTMSRRWRVFVGADQVSYYGVFEDTYPVVAESHDVVIIRSYRTQERQFWPNSETPTSIVEIRNYLAANPDYQSFYVLGLDDGKSKYVAPVAVGGIGDGVWSIGPQVVVKKFDDGTEVAYLLWRNGQACADLGSGCDARDDTTLGEMDIKTGNIRFVQDYRNQGVLRLHTDEQSPLAMAGNTILHAHWMTLGALKITNRSSNLGGSYLNPIRTIELSPVLNTLASGTCNNRSGHFCYESMGTPCDSYQNDPGFYIYYATQCIYDQLWTLPVRSVAIGDKVIYWKSVDGAIIAIESANP